ncbi:hypothetical protein Q5424_26700 [Conexibacter sp. JD483]|uniref:hypothetical protein n=1 Tax=unclassified Conexibacter TaxID=2627773 RepID=UPI002716C788|nr:MULTISPECIES: hypothetical protein [unclassified Conexibacter]MDO8189492.1 hypothetical protein [Conexibacter sp. CPCC 205706]MDO8202082.1 hypothetical protein [Conexibacter sp. CPCC 205762]MDR9372718.1 hypothetical protein [Conexibacter sp. JD483]
MSMRRAWLVLPCALAAALPGALAPAAQAASPRTSGDAYATPGANDCTWTIGTAGVEKVVQLASGSFTMTSLKNKVASPALETVQGATASDEFRFAWDGTTLRGSSGGWSCGSGSAAVVTAGGENAVQVDVTLARTGVNVVKHYLVYPSTAVIREWAEYVNSDSRAHRLTAPSFLEQRLLGNDVADVDLRWMTGARIDPGAKSYTVKTKALSARYAREFDSYDLFNGCATDADATGACATRGFNETSATYIPWFSLQNRRTNDGVMFGFDHHGRWRTTAGLLDGAQTAVSMTLPSYDASVAAGATVTMPRAFTAMWSGDLDDMTNRLLDWQYRYMWDLTRREFYADVRLVGEIGNGAHPFGGVGGPYDPAGLIQKVFGYADHIREIGGDGYHRDIGWYTGNGDWTGPDWGQTIPYLGKSDVRHTIYYSAYNADPPAPIYQQHPEWFVNGSPCGYADRLADLSIAGAASWVLGEISRNADLWGDYAWRNDSCPVANVDGATQLGQSQAFQRLQEQFLAAYPDSSVQNVDSGGYEIGWEMVRRASSLSFTDWNGVDQAHDGGSRLFNVDKLSGMGGNWPTEYCIPAWNMLLGINPEFVNDPDDPTAIECMRRLLERYHFLQANGVVGRWIHQFHPASSLDARAWFQRVSGDRAKSVLIYKGEPDPHSRTCYPVTICPEPTDFPGATPSGSVTVYPKGLDPATTYTVTFEFASGSSSRTGADLMSRGVTLSRPPAGELVFLGMPKNPGGGRDTTAPAAPGNVTARYATNVNYDGVDVTWDAATDDGFVSRYEVLRDGVKIATVAKGRYHFDHDPAASTHATYSVRAIDADGNVSRAGASTPLSGTDRTAVDDDARALTYQGTWTHATGRAQAYGGTLSSTDTDESRVKYTFTGSGITLFARLGPNWGRALVQIDGRTETTVDLWAPDANNWRIPVFSRTWPSRGRHTIVVERSGRANVHASSNAINVDGFQVRTTRPVTTDDADASFSGAGWKRPQKGFSEALDEGATVSSAALLEDPATCHSACQGFRGTQGTHNWRYQDLRAGVWTDISNYPNALPDGPAWHDPRIPGGVVYASAIHPGESNDTARTWIAPRPGVVDVTSRVFKVDPNGDGVVVKITKNGTTVVGPRTLAGADTVGFALDAAGITVAQGDAIRFEINRNGAWYNDTTHWDPDVLYRADASCHTACRGFSGVQGQGNWHYQDVRGGSWQDIGGFGLHTPLPDGAAWHDDLPSFGGYIYRQFIHPGNGVEAARAWVAPRAGTIDIASRPAKADPGGQGVVVTITKNGSTTLAGPRTIAGNDTTGSAMDLSSVTVAAGDVIRFQITDNGSFGWDMARWDPEITYQSRTACALACQGFSDVQGSDGWHYQDRRNGTWLDSEAFTAALLPSGDAWHDDDPTMGGYLLRSLMHPGISTDAARAWVAPMTGTVDVTSRPFKDDVNPSGDGVVVRVTKNGATILGPRTIAATDGTGSAFDARAVDVVAGDVLRFEINRNGAWYSDMTAWDPNIAYTAAGAAPAVVYDSVAGSGTQAVEFTVTAQDVELIGRRCAACGKAEVYVDGVRVQRIDTFGYRGPDQWQTPIWHYSWPASGRHVIRLVPTGTSSPQANGSAVFVDGLQVNG